MWENWVQWCIENKPDQISEEEIINELKSGKSLYYGFDKKNNPIYIWKAKKIFPG